ncbi:ABC transporter substrate-binding protein [Spartinivicinus poritis]|uniref:ABC transporter substrate-binding protein n=1 Tax=Spartinivicinus poritis TaxID=2994640 RepID=A0ABT5UBX7_9GAMM|nr:ABC transporter substrate-binding protein [Spartinivicinus sp. A2-2]MDE1463878.1 ABC transporter substrate-binding protein [Spartinivicinus sp. A2-2]
MRPLKLIGAVLLAVCATTATAKEWKKVRIGVEGAYPPFSWTTEKGELKGFDIDIANALCAAMKAECKLVPQDWDGIIPALLARKYDAIVASMSITEERKKKVAFTNKYYHTPVKFIRKKGSAIEVTDAGLKGKTVGVQRSTVADKYITEKYGEVVTIKRYGTQDEAYLDMKAGRLDLLLGDIIPLNDGFLKKGNDDKFEFVGPDITDKRWFGEGIGIALRKRDKDLKDKLNMAIEQIRKDGTYDKIRAKYFDFDIYGD